MNCPNVSKTIAHVSRTFTKGHGALKLPCGYLVGGSSFHYTSPKGGHCLPVGGTSSSFLGSLVEASLFMLVAPPPPFSFLSSSSLLQSLFVLLVSVSVRLRFLRVVWRKRICDSFQKMVYLVRERRSQWKLWWGLVINHCDWTTRKIHIRSSYVRLFLIDLGHVWFFLQQ